MHRIKYIYLQILLFRFYSPAIEHTYTTNIELKERRKGPDVTTKIQDGLGQWHYIESISFGCILNTSWWVSCEKFLTFCHKSLQCLNVFSLSLIIQDMSHIFGENLLSPCASMNTNHSYTNRPGCIANGHLEVGITRLLPWKRSWSTVNTHNT